jgi:hypothetical protein
MWEPQPLTTLRASKACRGENFFFFTFLGLIKGYTYLHSCTCSIGLVYSTHLRTGNFSPLNEIFFVKILLKFYFTVYLFQFTEVSSTFAISSVTVLVSVSASSIQYILEERLK